MEKEKFELKTSTKFQDKEILSENPKVSCPPSGKFKILE